MPGFEFKTLTQLFTEGIYEVPIYQRQYAWRNEQLKDIWDDLKELGAARSVGASKHYTGTIVVKRVGEVSKFGKTFTRFALVDGQQRLSTLVILLFCLAERLDELGDEEGRLTARNIQNDYVSDESTRAGKLRLNGDDDAFYRDVVLKPAQFAMVGRTPRTGSEKRLAAAKAFFVEQLRQEPIEALQSVLGRVTNRLLFIRYEVGDELEAGVAFEVINDRGRPLTQVDKIKNYLIYIALKAGDVDLGRLIRDAWGELFRNLMDIERFEEEDYFLRYHWIMYRGEYETEKLADVHRRVKEWVRLGDRDALTAVRHYVRSLQEASLVFRELNDPNLGLGDLTETALTALRSLHCLRTLATFMPLLMASRVVFRGGDRFGEIARLCESFSVRAYKINNRRTDTKFAEFSRLAHATFRRRGEAAAGLEAQYQEVVGRIKEAIRQYGADEEVRRNLTQPNVLLEPYEARYLLYQLECGKCGKEAPPEWDEVERRAQIEHIWPNKPRGSETWDDMQRKAHETSRYRLGNLTLTFWNQELSNRDFSEKRPMYRDSNLRLQRELADSESWGPDEIDRRTGELIEMIMDRWKP